MKKGENPFAKYDEGAGDVIRMAERHLLRKKTVTPKKLDTMKPHETYACAIRAGWKPPKA